VDMGYPCPNRENGGCIFCLPASFTPSYLQKKEEIACQVAQGKQHLLKGRFTKYFGYFQQETCTSIPPAKLLQTILLLLTDDDCIGVILSTRPDYIDEQLLAPLSKIINQKGKECLFEIGLQTVHDRSLKLLNRNHSYEDFQNAVSLIQQANYFQLGVHLIFGIPGETEEDMVSSLKTVCALGIDALKLHHLQVIRNTPLHDLYKQGKVGLFSQEEYLRFLLTALPIIPAGVTIHRLWATSHPGLLVAPRWNVLANNLSRTLKEMMAEKGLRQGLLA
jgi:radical SAM protein (TIGR01212 family)